MDPDARALARAAGKARRAGVEIQFDRRFSDALDYDDGSFDRVFSSFMFHHLGRAEKERTLREVRRVLKVGGSFHLLDFDGPEPSSAGSRARGLHAHHRLVDNDERTVLGLVKDAGLAGVTKAEQRVMLGFVRLAYYRAGSTDG